MARKTWDWPARMALWHLKVWPSASTWASHATLISNVNSYQKHFILLYTVPGRQAWYLYGIRGDRETFDTAK
jgi:hypothetical protein